MDFLTVLLKQVQKLKRSLVGLDLLFGGDEPQKLHVLIIFFLLDLREIRKSTNSC